MSGIRLGCPQATIFRPKQTVTLTYAALIVKRVGLWTRREDLVARWAHFFRPAWPTKQPPSLTKVSERGTARRTRSFVPCCQPPCFRQGGIISIPDCLSTTRAEIFDTHRRALLSLTNRAAGVCLLLIALRQFVERLDFQQAPLIRVRPELQLLRLPLALHAHRKSFRVALSLDAERQGTSQVGAAVRGVVLLPVLVVAQHVYTVDVRRVRAVCLARAVLLKNHPPARPPMLR